MVSIKGIYDGKKIVATEPLPVEKRYKVIITFTEEITEQYLAEEEIRSFGKVDAGLSFWHNEAEDIYQDYLPKKY